jgi:hypothetical protein
MTSGSKKGTQISFSFLSKFLATNPLQFPPEGPYGEGCPLIGHFAYLSKTSSFRFPSKGAHPTKVPYMESLAERCITTRTLLHSSTILPGF